MRNIMPTRNLASVLQELLPKAIAWAETQSQDIAQTGQRLDATNLALARSVGVQNPERIRVKIVPAIPMPMDAALHEAAIQTGLLSQGSAGLTLGYGIFIAAGNFTTRVLSHECRHVQQYEAKGSIAAFLPDYLLQIVTVGYDKAPYEIDARAWERDAF
jgi:hypothetical protein